MKKNLLFAIGFLGLAAQSAFAMNLEFQFDINSSGPSMYACNAGLKHGGEAKICFDKVTGLSCDQGCALGNTSACTENTSPNTCACTGEENGNQGGSYMDFLSANWGDWSDNQDTSSAPYVLKLSDFSLDWKTLFPLSSEYAHQLKNLTINLGSEIYGAEYFVDICYRGPQIDYKDIPNLNFSLLGKVTVTNLKAAGVNFTNYQDLSKLMVKAETKCIMDDSFDYCSADTIPGVHLCGPEAHTLIQSSPLTEAFTSAQQLQLLSLGSMGSGSQRTPRFCYTRYSFSETSHQVRKWKEQKARVCTYTQISEQL
jgi:hypothetical protein